MGEGMTPGDATAHRLTPDEAIARIADWKGKDVRWEELGGGITKAVADTAAFLRDQGGIPSIQPSYAPYVTARFVTAAAN